MISRICSAKISLRLLFQRDIDSVEFVGETFPQDFHWQDVYLGVSRGHAQPLLVRSTDDFVAQFKASVADLVGCGRRELQLDSPGPGNRHLALQQFLSTASPLDLMGDVVLRYDR